MKRILRAGIIGVISCFLLVQALVPLVYADEYDEVTKQLEQTKKELEMLQSANDTNKQTYENLNGQIESIKQQVAVLEQDIDRKEKEVARAEKVLTQQKDLLDARILSHYKNLDRNPTALLQIFAGDNLSESLQNYFYQKAFLTEDQESIVEIVSYIGGVEQVKEELVVEKTRLEPIKTELAKQSAFLAQEIDKADTYEGELKQKIADLSAKQKAILASRSGGGQTTSVGTVPTGGDPAATIAFKSQAPANSFAAFSFGAYTHRNGMSQYGADARGEAGQSYQDILAAYYPGTTLETRGDIPGTINVDGHGALSLEDLYLYGIAEMPATWHPEALKAQAIAARTYAVRRIGWPENASGSICTTEACQVYLPSKAASPPPEWKAAVDATRGQVLLKDGKPAITQYASTSGGYLNTSGWDTTDGNGSGDWTSRAYESIAGSPWFYRSWYRKGYRDDADSCGRAHPWLSQEEFSDIINAWIVRKDPKGADVNRIVPVTINQCGIGSTSGDPYSMNELRDLANKSGGAVTSVSSVSVSNNGSGQTTSVTLETNRGRISIPGAEFKETFNIRAPGYVRIPQHSFSFFNIEQS